ncbi:unnamed protein product [Cylicostephanus goldi]|uniref:Uncharacterized protein n=1 Tax=Cylicostephanus goldi TaxID=71465 RepID=A0A3P6QX23_CYLGO|nr:unnamed protein product [Cylicostephanus goldi]
MDPLSAEHANGRPASWVGFDEISMTSPPYDGRNSVATEERLELEDNERAVVTPLPTKEVIAGELCKSCFEENLTISLDIYHSMFAFFPVNSKIVATIYPENTMCSWVIPPRYDPYSVPSILAAEGLTVSIYFVNIRVLSDILSLDVSRGLRDLAFWMTLSIVILLIVLFANSEGGILVMSFCLFWCVMLFAGIIACAIIRKQIRIGLRHCVQSANKVLIKNNMIAGVEDKGQLSCHKVVVNLTLYHGLACDLLIKLLFDLSLIFPRS